jgi:predicted DNA-binding protein YlxM (UPF0122 family)
VFGGFMVARKLSRDEIIDAYLLYNDVNRDFTLEWLAEKFGISRSRLGKLFKRVNPKTLEINYGVDDSQYLEVYKEWKNDGGSLRYLSKKYGVSRNKLSRIFKRISDGN